MAEHQQQYTGHWLHDGDRLGTEFSHSSQDYVHAEEGEVGSTKMRHAVVRQGDREVKVWAPAGWTEAQIAEALESNW